MPLDSQNHRDLPLPINYRLQHSRRRPQKPVLRSASALVEDQRTGEFLVQKHAEAVVPIASITKLMTAMVVLDAQMDLQESLTIEPEDVDTLRHSRSRLPVGTRLTRRRPCCWLSWLPRTARPTLWDELIQAVATPSSPP